MQSLSQLPVAYVSAMTPPACFSSANSNQGQKLHLLSCTS